MDLRFSERFLAWPLFLAAGARRQALLFFGDWLSRAQSQALEREQFRPIFLQREHNNLFPIMVPFCSVVWHVAAAIPGGTLLEYVCVSHSGGKMCDYDCTGTCVSLPLYRYVRS